MFGSIASIVVGALRIPFWQKILIVIGISAFFGLIDHSNRIQVAERLGFTPRSYWEGVLILLAPYLLFMSLSSGVAYLVRRKGGGNDTLPQTHSPRHEQPTYSASAPETVSPWPSPPAPKPAHVTPLVSSTPQSAVSPSLLEKMGAPIKEAFDLVLPLIFAGIFLVLYFPGGLVVMGLSCEKYRLEWWDWLLSVILPGYGLYQAIFAC